MTHPVDSRRGLERELSGLLALSVSLAVGGAFILVIAQSDGPAILSTVATLAVISSLLLAGGVTPIAIGRLVSSVNARTVGSVGLTVLASFILLVTLSALIVWYWD